MSEKKGSKQMIELANRLDKAGISFMWFIFSDTKIENAHPNMFFMPPRFDLASVIAGCDYGVQFTCDESFGLFPVECLKCGTPVILTDLPVFRELGIDEKNAYFYDWDMNGVDVKELLKIPKVSYKEPSSDKIYKELLS
jgi:glycosyltransferase involved in cell wall biosynthesis